MSEYQNNILKNVCINNLIHMNTSSFASCLCEYKDLIDMA